MKFLSLFLALALSLSPAVSKNTQDEVASEVSETVTVVTDSATFTIPRVEREGQLMVPVRKTCEGAGFTVEYFNSTQSTAIQPKDSKYTTAIFKIGSDKIAVNKYWLPEKLIKLPTSVTFENGEMYAPIEGVAEAMELKVAWKDSNTVGISKAGLYTYGGTRSTGAKLDGKEIVPANYDSIMIANNCLFASRSTIAATRYDVYDMDGGEVTSFLMSIDNNAAVISGMIFIRQTPPDYPASPYVYIKISPDGAVTNDISEAEFEEFSATHRDEISSISDFLQPVEKKSNVYKTLLSGASVTEENGKYGLVSDSGETISEPMYDFSDIIYSESGKVYAVKNGDCFIVLAFDGSVAAASQYREILSLGSDMLVARDANGVFAEDFDGNIIIPSGIYDEIELSVEGSAPLRVKSGEQYSFVTRDNKPVGTASFVGAGLFCEGKAFVYDEDKNVAIIDENGNFTAEFGKHGKKIGYDIDGDITSSMIICCNLDLGEGAELFLDTSGNLYTVANRFIYP